MSNYHIKSKKYDLSESTPPTGRIPIFRATKNHVQFSCANSFSANNKLPMIPLSLGNPQRTI